ncbi:MULTISPECIES: dephospho-CoA kinase [Methylomonas]|uniref:Dephospho-CoA kinase n=2 Tax=Methylomonas TaxID=416 RepID=A0A126T2L0_9GAMM|nr:MULTISPECIES: dephospho-CoA kinase [Methylomonas]AMK76321.1 dephospho-CoA kinase [Methylomonas denitrificans]OAI00757.1 dephospho-CoA kinase [Methylomonas methanica]TCV88343.1 dephospho-CoA kinase [Methylomonas methanica]
MLKIGLTGGIGSGKSTVCQLFAEFGVPIVDADLIARQLVEPGQPALLVIAASFGSQMLNQDGSLNRARLRDAVFADADKKRELDGIMHPLVYEKIAADVSALTADYCVIAVPLLLESKNAYAVDRVLLIDCPVDAQIERVIARDKLTRQQVQAIIDSQMSRQERLSKADDVIDNIAGPEQLAEQVKRLHNSYILLATVRTQSA